MSPFVFRKLLRVGKSSMSLFFHKFLFNKDHTGGTLLSPSATNTQSMSRAGLFDFSTRTPNRYWWFQQPSNLYLPLIFSHLTSQELLLMRQWYDDTDRIPLHGEMNVPAMSIIYGLISGSSINSIVQLGHYSGWSTLLLGFLLRSMGKSKSFVSFDIDDKMTLYTKKWISRAGLTDYAEALTYNSSSANAVNAADQFLGTRPKLLIIDSSHTYEHTLKELDLWWPQIQPGGLVLLHDVSLFAAEFDPALKGGCLRALEEWASAHGQPYFALNRNAVHNQPTSQLTYMDGCGLGILQKGFD